MEVRVVLNRAGVGELLRSAEVKAELERRAARIAAAAGAGNEVESGVGRTRARAAVVTETFEAKHSEAKDRTLTRALDAGR